MFQPINNRLAFFFPRNAFVYLDSRTDEMALFSGKARYELDAVLESAGLQLAFPPDFSKRLSINEQDGATYWEYHFPGLRSLHLRKQQILLDEVLRGFDLGLAAKLILRKLNLSESGPGPHLLYFDAQGHTWHAAIKDATEALVFMQQVAASGFKGIDPGTLNSLGTTEDTISDKSQSFHEEPRKAGLFHKVKVQRNQKATEELESLQSYAADEGDLRPVSGMVVQDYDDNLLLTLEGGWQQFLVEQQGADRSNLHEDSEVLRTLLVIRKTETEQGFFKIMASLMSQMGGLDNRQQQQLNPVLARIIRPTDGSFWRFKLSSYDLSVHFPDLWLDIKMQPLQYAVYQLFLQHPEGIRLKEIRAYREILYQNYRVIKATDNPDLVSSQIDRVTDIRNDDSLMQCMSNIKRHFLKKIGYDAMQPYIIKRPARNMPHRIEAASAFIQ